MSIFRCLRNFRADDSGTSSIEFLFWMPVMVGMIALATDATLLMNKQQGMYNLARDASRQVALDQATPSQAEARLRSYYSSERSTVSVQVNDGFVTTLISVPFDETAKTSKHFIDGELTATVAMWVEVEDE